MRSLISILWSVLTTTIDSYLWQSILFPEAHNIYFNVLQGKSADWGISPWHHYLSSAFPRILMAALPLSLLGLLTEKRVRSLVIGPLILVGGMSLLKHKEWRFIVYVVPIFNVAAARGAHWL